MAKPAYLADVWSVTDFGDSELSEYAAARLCTDTRLGVQAMAALAFVMQIGVVLFSWALDVRGIYTYTSLLLGLLSLHVFFSANYLRDLRTLHALGIVFLIIGALSLTLLAHRAGELHISMMAGTVMLFVAIPLVPWALRETSVVIGLAYLLMTSSLIAVPGRFTSESLWVLQFLVFGAALVVLVITARNTAIRKQDIRARFELESAHDEMELLMMQDHLTGAWNRRFLEKGFPRFLKKCCSAGKALHMAILDIDDFKGINDEFGHQIGDHILIAVADTLVRHLAQNGHLIRLGGDEFQILYCGDDLEALIGSAIRELQGSDVARLLQGRRPISLSAGIASSEPGQCSDAEELYRNADRALYAAKRNRPLTRAGNELASRTGTWRL